MLKTAVILGAVAAVVLSDFCRHETGSWSSGMMDGAKDFATTGVAPNDKYFCWEACLNSAFVNQNFKVLLANPRQFKYIETMRTYEERLARAVRPKVGGQADNDPNADSCIDPVLRDDINAALLKVTNHSATAIARTLQYQIAKPNWVYNVVEAGGGLAADGYYSDMNFCLYISFLDPGMYEIRLAAIDKS